MIKRYTYTLSILCVLMVMLASSAFAQSPPPPTLGSGAVIDGNIGTATNGLSAGELFYQSSTMVGTAAERSENIVFGLGALGVVAMGTLAVFGRFNWAWFFTIIGSLVVLGGLSQGMTFLAGHNPDTTRLITR